MSDTDGRKAREKRREMARGLLRGRQERLQLLRRWVGTADESLSEEQLLVALRKSFAVEGANAKITALTEKLIADTEWGMALSQKGLVIIANGIAVDAQYEKLMEEKMVTLELQAATLDCNAALDERMAFLCGKSIGSRPSTTSPGTAATGSSTIPAAGKSTVSRGKTPGNVKFIVVKADAAAGKPASNSPVKNAATYLTVCANASKLKPTSKVSDISVLVEAAAIMAQVNSVRAKTQALKAEIAATAADTIKRRADVAAIKVKIAAK